MKSLGASLELGVQDGAAKAVRYLDNHFNLPHLLLLKVYNEIREISPAQNQSQVPRVAETLLCLVKSISALICEDKSPLPADVTQVIFQALHMYIEEKLKIMLSLQNLDGVSITFHISKTLKLPHQCFGPPGGTNGHCQCCCTRRREGAPWSGKTTTRPSLGTRSSPSRPAERMQ